MANQDKIIGILGGMGPGATVDFFQKILSKTPADKDQDHLRILIDNNPKVPDRTKAILEGGENPTPVIKEMAQGLEKKGTDVLVMPCNTAHYFYQDIITGIDIPMLNMIELTTKYISNRLESNSKVGVLATTGTIETKIYQQQLTEFNLQTILPKSSHQEQVMEAIYKVKGGEVTEDTTDLLKGPVSYLEEQGAKAIIAGCTELPVIFKEKLLREGFLVDPTDILAEAAVSFAKGIHNNINN